MSLDDRISRGLTQMANRLEPDAHAALPGVHKAGRRKVVVRGVTTAATVGLALALAVIVPTTILRDGGRPGQVAEQPPATGMPDSFVVATSNAITVYSTETGEPLRTLFETEDYRIRGLAVSPDRQTLYFGRELIETTLPEQRDVELLAVPLAGGQVAHVADGHSPAVSADGTKLAYVGAGSVLDAGPGLRCYSGEPIVVRDLATGTEETWPWAVLEGSEDDPYSACGGPSGLAWSPDGTKLAYERNIGDPLYETRVLDVTADGDILAAPAIDTRKSVRSPRFTADGSLLVIEDIGFHSVNPRSDVHTVDLDAMTLSGTQVEGKELISSIAVDATGTYVIGAEPYACGNRCVRVITVGDLESQTLAEIDFGRDDYAIVAW